MTPSLAAPDRIRGPYEPPSAAVPESAVALRLASLVDAEALGDRLLRLWPGDGAARRGAPRVELSVVETCGRDRRVREHDALRLLRAEAHEAATGSPAGTLRATLVCLDAHEHLLLLATAPSPSTPGLLARIARELCRHYPIDAVALA